MNKLLCAPIAAMLLIGCRSSTSPTPTVTFRADVTDPAGDVFIFPGFPLPNAPDLRSATVEILASGRLRLSVRLLPGTFNRDTSNVEFDFDVDENPATGASFQGLGIDDVVDLGSAFRGSRAVWRHFSGTGFGFSGEAVATFVADGMDVEFPLSFLGGDDGRMTFRVQVSHQVTAEGFTGIVDTMPNPALPGGVVR